jgi:sugar lactone lactonase YvrE
MDAYGFNGTRSRAVKGVVLDPKNLTFHNAFAYLNISRRDPAITSFAVSPDSKYIYFVLEGDSRIWRKSIADSRRQAEHFAGNTDNDQVDHIVTNNPHLTTFGEPAGLAVDSQGWVYVSDTHNKRIVKISPDMSTVGLVAGGLESEVFHQDDQGTLTVISDGQTPVDQLPEFDPRRVDIVPGEIKVDSAGRVYVYNDRRASVDRIAPLAAGGVYPEVFVGGTGFGAGFDKENGRFQLSGSGVTFDLSPDDQTLYLADPNGRTRWVVSVETESKRARMFAGGVFAFYENQDRDRAVAGTHGLLRNQVLLGPSGISVSRDGKRLFVSDGPEDAIYSFPTDDEDRSWDVVLHDPRGMGANARREADMFLRNPLDLFAAPDGSLLAIAGQDERLVLIGPDDEFNGRLRSLLEENQRFKPDKSFPRVGSPLSDLKLLAKGDPLAAVRATYRAGVSTGVEVSEGGREVRAQLAEGVRFPPELFSKVDSPTGLPTEMGRRVVEYLEGTDLVQPFQTIRARIASKLVGKYTRKLPPGWRADVITGELIQP